VFVGLDERTVVDAIAGAREAGCEALAVCLLWSIVNPAHELRVGELIEALWPGVPYTLSHRLNPIVREYRRASSTAIDASLKPLMQEHLRGLADDLAAAGFGGHLLIATSSGGSWRPGEVIDRPVYSVGSGPSLAPVAALAYARADLGTDSLIVCDTGGTTFDVGLVRDGQTTTTAETWLGGRWIGHITGVRSVDVKSIGAGGGSIAWIDPGGLLCVGPRSAGADPGPACYGRGGTEPTVTDAAVVLGYLEPDRFLGGRLALDPDAARTAIRERVAEPLGMDVDEAALATIVIATENIVSAIRELTIAQGVDPREVGLVAGGGASGLNVAAIARELGMQAVLVPRTAGALSACGALLADLVRDFARTCYAETHRFDPGSVNAALADAQADADAFLAELADVRPDETRTELSVDARYRSQVWELEVPLPVARFADGRDVTALEDAFHDVHERVFAVREEGQYVECLVWRCRATAVLAKPALAPGRGARPDASPSETRVAVFADGGAVETPRFDGSALPPGTEIAGPAIVREPTTTVVVPPGARVTVTPLGNYLLQVGGHA
jgi:N-methylhydantoinase A